MLPTIEQRLASELAAKPAQVAAAVALLDEGATVPFIARYRKEATGGLDDIQLRLLEERLALPRELEDRRRGRDPLRSRTREQDAGTVRDPWRMPIQYAAGGFGIYPTS